MNSLSNMSHRKAFAAGAIIVAALVLFRALALQGTGRELPVPLILLVPSAAGAGGGVGILFVTMRHWRTEGGFKAAVAYWMMGCIFLLPLTLLAIPFGEILDSRSPPSYLELAGLVLVAIGVFGIPVGLGIKIYGERLLGES